MIYRIHKTKDYTVMSNAHLRDDNLSLKAKGLLSVMLSLPDDWDYSVAGLCSICKESKAAIESALGDLKKSGYLIVTKLMPNQTESKRIEYQYDVYENKQDGNFQGVENQPLENQPLENQAVEHQGVENRPQLNTYIHNTDKQNTDKRNTEHTRRFTPPSAEEVAAYCRERKNGIDAEVFCDFYQSKGWMVGKDPMKDWKASVRTWEKKRKAEKPKREFSSFDADEFLRDAIAASDSLVSDEEALRIAKEAQERHRQNSGWLDDDEF